MDIKIKHTDDDDFDGDIADINIVPLVDVMLVLLIIFMVTAPLSIGGISVKLPTSKARSASVANDRVVLSINQQGLFFIEKMQVSKKHLEKRLKAIYEFRDKKDLYIRADKRVIYRHVVDAMSAAKVAGVSKISMLTEPPQGG